MHDWCAVLARELGAGRQTVMVTVVEVLGSAPCAPGARLLVAGKRVWGTVGGGNLEFTAIAQARRLAGSARQSLLQSLPLGPLLAQCCGGRVRLLYERFEPAQAPRFATAAAIGGQFRTRIEPAAYERHLCSGDAAAGVDAPEGQLVDGIWLEPVRQQRRQVVIFGGGHIGKALVQILRQAPCDLLVIDPRPDVADDLGALVPVISAAAPDGMELWWKPSAVAVILTHSHELDYLWTRQLLLRGDAGWCGVIGSRTKRARFLKRLRADGVDAAQMAQLVCPIGLPGLSSKHPGIVAISTAAQLLPLLTIPIHAGAGQSRACPPPGENHLLESTQ